MMKSRILSLAAAVALAGPLTVQASPVTWDFTVNGGSVGPLAGVTSSGSFTFDSSIIPVVVNPPPADGLVNGTGLLTGLSFAWDGLSYDQTTANTGALEFDSSGALTGVNFGTSCSPYGWCQIAPDTLDWDVDGSWYYPPGSTNIRTDFTYAIDNGVTYDGFAMLSPHVTAAPEIDPAGAASAITLLFGGLAVLRGRMRRHESPPTC